MVVITALHLQGGPNEPARSGMVDGETGKRAGKLNENILKKFSPRGRTAAVAGGTDPGPAVVARVIDPVRPH